MTDDNESYVAVPWDVVVKRCDELRRSIERDREVEERGVYQDWAQKKNASRWRRFWGKPKVTVEDAKKYYAAQSYDYSFYDPVERARSLYYRQYDLAGVVKRMARSAHNVDGKVLLSRSDFDSLNF